MRSSLAAAVQRRSPQPGTCRACAMVADEREALASHAEIGYRLGMSSVPLAADRALALALIPGGLLLLLRPARR
jgi:hypothetical protein